MQSLCNASGTVYRVGCIHDYGCLLDHFIVLTFGGYKVGFFVPPGRPWDEQWHDLFAVDMPGQPVV